MAEFIEILIVAILLYSTNKVKFFKWFIKEINK